jgi:hypothetical protein
VEQEELDDLNDEELARIAADIDLDQLDLDDYH